MKSIITIFLSVQIATASAQGLPLIKGHHLGESLKEFSTSEHLVGQIASCQTDRMDRVDRSQTVSAYHVNQMSEAELQELRQAHSLGKMSRKKIVKAAANGSLNTPNTPDHPRSFDEQATCRKLLDVFIDGKLGSYSQDRGVGDTVLWTFLSGKLDALETNFDPDSFARTALDLTTRLGSQPDMTEPNMFNGYGATWKDQHAIWITSELRAELLKSNNPVRPRLTFTVENRATFDARVKSLMNRKSPLD